MKYRKRPVVIEAVKFNMVEYVKNGYEHLDWFSEYPEWLKDGIENGEILVNANRNSLDYVTLDIKTNEGVMTCYPYDYIIKEPFPTSDRRFYPCKPDIFEQTYEEVKG